MTIGDVYLNTQGMNIQEVIVFIIYLVFMLSIGIWFFFRDKHQTEKGYFLGDRKMGPWVAALSAGASDNGTSDINIRIRTRPSLDSSRTRIRLFIELDI